jgi:hypothetical protein
VGHIDNEIGTDRIGNLAHAAVVNKTAVRGCACNQDLRAVELSIRLKGIVVDDTSLEVDSVREGLKVRRDCGDPALESWLGTWEIGKNSD